MAFAEGATSAVVKGQLKGDADVDYLVRAAAGQTLSVSLKVSNRSNYFNVLPPGSADVAMYAAQTGDCSNARRSSYAVASTARPRSRSHRRE